MTEPDAYLATGFRNVDHEADLAKFKACLGFMQGLPSFIAYKNRALELMRLAPGQVVADLGCGLGNDVKKIANYAYDNAKTIGVDGSRALLAEARQTCAGLANVALVQADLHDLPLATGTLDAVRVDRTLQHVADPKKVIAEMHRVLKPGGWLVCAEPDWGTFAIDCADPATAALVGERWKKSFRNPHVGRELAGMLGRAGLGDVAVEEFPLLVEGLEAVNVVYDVVKTVEMMQEDWKGEEGRLTAWLEGLRELDKRGGVSAEVRLFLVCGQKAE
jgi:SAM-dependent methyltransferase